MGSPMMQLPPDFNPHDLGRGPMIMGLTWTFAGLALITVLLRFYARVSLKTGIASDDWLMGVACICNLASQSFITVGYHFGMGKHDKDMLPPDMLNMLKWMWLANTPGLLVCILARISITILLVRVFGGVHRWLRWFLITVTGFCTVLTMVILPCVYLQSKPLSGVWNPMEPAKRWDPRIYSTMAYVGQSLWTFTDLTYVLFPVGVIWGLQMPTAQRIGLVILMSVSLFTMVMSILKTVGVKHIADSQKNPNAKDVLYDASLEILWTCLEQACVIMMGCVPPLRSVTRLPVYKTITSSISSVLRSNKSSKASSGYSHTKGPYVDLEMQRKLGRIGREDDSILQTTVVEHEDFTESKSNLVKGNGITTTTETSISYSSH